MRRVSRSVAAFGAATIAALLLIVAAPASAHNYLVASTPEEGSILSQLPEEFSVTTNDTLLDLAGDGGGFAIRVIDSGGGYYGDGCFTIRDASLSTAAALGDAGHYRMLWQLVSADGHTVSGEIGFEWAPDSEQVLSQPLDAPPACGGGTLDEATPPGETDEGAPSAESTTAAVDSGTLIFVGGAAALVLAAGVAIFLISVKRKKSES